MQCPVCTDTALAISSREGVEIDYCPQCRGVWLDRGELDKIIDRVAAAPAGAAPPSAPASRPDYDDRGYERGYERGYDDPRYESGYDDRGRDPRDVKRRKRRSFLDDLFDFD
jgi:Zn-finger nucleic acid-binding protein